MIDNDGYRLNIGIILLNAENKVFWGQRRGPKNSWQFPQGGLNNYETLNEAMYRELYEEIGLRPSDVAIIKTTRRWIYYDLPKKFLRTKRDCTNKSGKECIGQRQRWFLLRLIGADSKINLNQSPVPEFISWNWVDYWYPLEHVVDFKRPVYKTVLTEFNNFRNSSIS